MLYFPLTVMSTYCRHRATNISETKHSVLLRFNAASMDCRIPQVSRKHGDLLLRVFEISNREDDVRTLPRNNEILLPSDKASYPRWISWCTSAGGGGSLLKFEQPNRITRKRNIPFILIYFFKWAGYEPKWNSHGNFRHTPSHEIQFLSIFDIGRITGSDFNEMNKLLFPCLPSPIATVTLNTIEV